MTKRARISQADMERAIKSVKVAGYERARLVFDLEARRIDIFLGESAAGEPGHNPWDDEIV